MSMMAQTMARRGRRNRRQTTPRREGTRVSSSGGGPPPSSPVTVPRNSWLGTLMSVHPNPRVEQRDDDVLQERRDEDEDCDDEGDRGHGVRVAGLDRLDEPLAHAVPAED